MKGHWARECHTPDHFMKLYQASFKRKDNNVEAHLTFQNDDNEAGPSNKYDVLRQILLIKMMILKVSQILLIWKLKTFMRILIKKLII